MKRLLALCALGLIPGCTDQAAPELSESDEARLSSALANYEQAGQTVDCVNSRDLRGNRSAGEGAIIFDGIGNRVWVNRPPAGCPSLEHGRALRTSTPSTRLCRGDIATVFDPVSGIDYGSCGLGDFTPYRRRPSAG